MKNIGLRSPPRPVPIRAEESTPAVEEEDEVAVQEIEDFFAELGLNLNPIVPEPPRVASPRSRRSIRDSAILPWLRPISVSQAGSPSFFLFPSSDESQKLELTEEAVEMDVPDVVISEH